MQELGETTVEFMKHIKKSVDPLNLFNPGKVNHDSAQSSRAYSEISVSFTRTP